MVNVFGSIKRKLSRRSSNPRDLTSNPTSPVTISSKPSSRGNTSNLAPPPSASPFTSGSPATRRPSNVISTADDQYAFLKSFDTVFLIDDSGSMAGRSWRETAEALETIAPICTQRDADGIDIYFLNRPDSSIYKNVTSAGTVIEIFQTVRPGGGTPTGQRLNKILKNYLQQYQASPESTKPINIIVITDGEPSDDVESVIINAAKKLDKFDAPSWQVGIQFFQVGNEHGAREHLKNLDDGLRELAGDDDLRDIVDTVPYTTGQEDEKLSAQGILKVVLGAVNRRIDRNSKELHRRG
ncbi:hypothetical protein BDV95DRAFT_508257 [Massariosphaeria phaeospora]|uniref:VWFA domain-containing protein n=1 Tax=Massariosphaeria phaeospora TaxID=100035 RepID=A0A7C8MEB1_9PLEO|nr:hypothetical protein BDV95DRAFT_508257 [Massariosphaeria phaeospora]